MGIGDNYNVCLVWCSNSAPAGLCSVHAANCSPFLSLFASLAGHIPAARLCLDVAVFSRLEPSSTYECCDTMKKWLWGLAIFLKQVREECSSGNRPSRRERRYQVKSCVATDKREPTACLLVLVQKSVRASSVLRSAGTTGPPRILTPFSAGGRPGRAARSRSIYDSRRRFTLVVVDDARCSRWLHKVPGFRMQRPQGKATRGRGLYLPGRSTGAAASARVGVWLTRRPIWRGCCSSCALSAHRPVPARVLVFAGVERVADEMAASGTICIRGPRLKSTSPLQQKIGSWLITDHPIPDPEHLLLVHVPNWHEEDLTDDPRRFSSPGAFPWTWHVTDVRFPAHLLSYNNRTDTA